MSCGYPADEDGEALRRVAAGGSDMTQPMTIDFSVAVADETAARALAKVAGQAGFDPSIYEDPDRHTWSVFCSRSMLATHAGVVEAQRELSKLAEPFGGRCDGWASFGN